MKINLEYQSLIIGICVPFNKKNEDGAATPHTRDV